jgi:hypothetical protein
VACNISNPSYVTVSTPTQYGTIYLASDRNITLQVFGGVTYSGSNYGYLTITGYGGTPNPMPNQVSAYAGYGQYTTIDLGLPAGYYSFLLYMSANGSSGHTASISCGSSITYTPTPSPTPSPSPGTSGGGGGGGGGISGFNQN